MDNHETTETARPRAAFRRRGLGLLMTLLIAGLPLVTTGCEKEQSRMDEAMEEVRDEVKDARENIEDEIDDRT